MTALDGASRTIIEQMYSDLLHIARDTQQVNPSLAASWSVSRDARTYRLSLQRGICFSDGAPFTADDVLFSFQVYLDAKLQSPQRELLLTGGVPVKVTRQDSHTVVFHLSQPYAAGERLFDSIMMLPRHLLQGAYNAGRLAEIGGLSASPGPMAGLGPFVFGSYSPGQHLILRRNPHYWGRSSCGVALPYLDEVVFVFAGSEAGQVRRFQAGEADVISRFSASVFAGLEREAGTRGFRVMDLGPGLEHHFVVFNLNDVRGRNLPGLEKRQRWFRNRAFRQAISLASDRGSIVRIVFHGRASALASHVTPGNARWINRKLVPAERSIAAARACLAGAGFSWNKEGFLLDPDRTPVEFTILANAGNPQRVQIAAILQEDWKHLGMRVQLASLESRAAMDRVFRSFDYDTAIMALAGGDADPTAEMNVWSLGGATHLWNLTAKIGGMAEPWEVEIDRLMQQQMVTLDQQRRKQAYDRVQELVAQYLPVVPLVAPHVLVGARTKVRNFRPAVLNDYTLWNAAELYVSEES